MRRIGRLAIAVALGLAVVSGCPRKPPPPALAIVPPDRWPELGDDLDPASLDEACTASLAFFDRLPAERVFGFAAEQRTAAELARGVAEACEIVLSATDPGDLGRRLQNEFLLLRSTGRDGHGEVLFTGYYEPVLDARRSSSDGYERAVYGIPDDLITVDLADFDVEVDPPRLVGRVDGRRLVPYPDRDDIDFGEGLVSGAEILGFVADPVDVFFLHVQGSGTLVFPDGGRLRAGYAATNGRPYRSIGRLLIDDGLVTSEEMSMQAIRAYLEQHPDDVRRVLAYNPSYVFFRRLAADGGPLGCYGEPLSAGRSIATDRRLFPAPVLGWIRATVPSLEGADESIARFVLNQDTGGAIRGPGRVDLFFGQGEEAGELAGRTKHLGELYFLLPKKSGR
jgi:membrane-bound lytic murein transglycosylase A